VFHLLAVFFLLADPPFFLVVQLGHWVGSSVVHLGDHNVPNALSFIDKYTQVSRILNPIVLTIKAIPRLCERKDVAFYIRTVFGGPDALKMLILTDFFRSAFDGSGADNFFDAGSCRGIRRRTGCRLWARGAESSRPTREGPRADRLSLHLAVSFDIGSCIDGRLTSAWNW
jgi:hypothetical protein